VTADSEGAELCNGSSRMTGNLHVRFQGEGVAATPLPYPTKHFQFWGSGLYSLTLSRSGAAGLPWPFGKTRSGILDDHNMIWHKKWRYG
jgi:hypothetical protein